MSFFEDIGKGFTNSWAGAIFNPVGYQLQHVSIEEAVGDYVGGHPPSDGIDPESEDEEGFLVRRQQWIDACVGAVKARDVGYAKANVANACGGRFDEDETNSEVQNAISLHNAQEQEELKTKIKKNNQAIAGIIATTIFVGLIVYLFND